MAIERHFRAKSNKMFLKKTLKKELTFILREKLEKNLMHEFKLVKIFIYVL